jgi:hypothetical protein
VAVALLGKEKAFWGLGNTTNNSSNTTTATSRAATTSSSSSRIPSTSNNGREEVQVGRDPSQGSTATEMARTDEVTLSSNNSSGDPSGLLPLPDHTRLVVSAS